MNGQLLVPERTTTAIPADLPAIASIVGQSGTENFPVASRLLPRAVRDHLLAVYGFARLADDIGDEAEGDRLALLDWLDAELERAARGEATHPLLQRLTPTIAQCDLSLEPFKRLIEANRRDQVVRRYESIEDLIDYCMLSAAPVGELVLGIFGVSTPERIALSDDVCNALQIIEHVQDVAEDFARDRVYVPQSDLRAFGCDEHELSAPTASPVLRTVLRYEAGRARRLLASAVPLASQLPLQPRIAVCGFAAGGLAALDGLERGGYAVLGQDRHCRPRPLRLGLHLAGTVLRASTSLGTSTSTGASTGRAG
jgi:squalene synthase HpnC